MKPSPLATLDQQVLWHPFTQMAEWDPLVIVAGEGNYLLYLPKGQPRVLCLRDPGHATYLKLTYG